MAIPRYDSNRSYVSEEDNLWGYLNNTVAPNLSSDYDPETGQSISAAWREAAGYKDPTPSYTPASSVPSGGGGGNNYSDYMSQMQAMINSAMASQQSYYDQQLAAMREAEAAAKAARKAAYDQSVGVIGNQSDEARRQAYIQNRLSERKLPQQMAAMGLSGGMSESTAANLRNSYGENLNELENARLQALAEQAAAYQAGLAQDTSNFQTQIAGILGNQAQAKGNLDMWAAEQQLNALNTQQQRAYQAARNNAQKSFKSDFDDLIKNYTTDFGFNRSGAQSYLDALYNLGDLDDTGYAALYKALNSYQV